MKKITDKELNEIIEYGKWLESKLSELSVSQAELARAVGKSQKTISRYIKGENTSLPDAETRKKIEEYLESLSEYRGRKAMSPHDFGLHIRRMLHSSKITQSELAKMIGTDQRTVSGYINGTIKTNAQEQVQIIKGISKIRVRKRTQEDAAREYSKTLKENLEELCIPVEELERRLRRPSETVEQYLNGTVEVMPLSDINMIQNLIREKQYYRSYRHMPSKEYGDYLKKMMDAFRIDSEKLARMTEFSTEDIEKIISGEIKTSAKKQKFILTCLYALAEYTEAGSNFALCSIQKIINSNLIDRFDE